MLLAAVFLSILCFVSGLWPLIPIVWLVYALTEKGGSAAIQIRDAAPPGDVGSFFRGLVVAVLVLGLGGTIFLLIGSMALSQFP